MVMFNNKPWNGFMTGLNQHLMGYKKRTVISNNPLQMIYVVWC